MPCENMKPGDLVTLLTGENKGLGRIVSQPITEEHPGHVLVYKGGNILGVQVTMQEVRPSDQRSEGWLTTSSDSAVISSRLGLLITSKGRLSCLTGEPRAIRG